MRVACAGYERLRRPRAERNISVSGGLTRGTRAPSGRAPGVSPPTGPEEWLIRQLAWDTPLSEARPLPG